MSTVRMAFAARLPHREPGNDAPLGRKSVFPVTGTAGTAHAAALQRVAAKFNDTTAKTSPPAELILHLNGQTVPLSHSVTDALRQIRSGYVTSNPSSTLLATANSQIVAPPTRQRLDSSDALESLDFELEIQSITAAHKIEVAALKASIAELDAKVESLNAILGQTSVQFGQKSGQLADSEQQSKALRDELQAVRQELSSSRAAEADLRRRLDDKSLELSSAIDALGTARTEISQQMESIERERSGRSSAEALAGYWEQACNSRDAMHKEQIERLVQEHGEALAQLRAEVSLATSHAQAEVEAVRASAQGELEEARRAGQAQLATLQATVDDALARQAAAETQVALLRPRVAELTGERDGLRAKLASTVASSDRKLAEATARADGLGKDLSAAQAKVSTLEHEVGAYRERVSSLESHASTSRHAGEEQARAEAARRAVAETALAEAQGQVQALTKDKEALQEQVQSSDSKLRETTSSLAKAKDEAKGLQARHASAVDKLALYATDVSTARLDKATLHAELAEERQRSAALKESLLNAAQEAEDRASAAHEELVHAQAAIVEERTRANDLAATVSALQEDLSRARSKSGKASVDGEALRDRAAKAEAGLAAALKDKEQALRDKEQAMARAREEYEGQLRQQVEAANTRASEAIAAAEARVKAVEDNAKQSVEQARREAEARVQAATAAAQEAVDTATKEVEEARQAAQAAESSARDSNESALASSQAAIAETRAACEAQVQDAERQAQETVARSQAEADRRVEEAVSDARANVEEAEARAREAVEQAEARAKAAIGQAEARASLAESRAQEALAQADERADGPRREAIRKAEQAEARALLAERQAMEAREAAKAAAASTATLAARMDALHRAVAAASRATEADALALAKMSQAELALMEAERRAFRAESRASEAEAMLGRLSREGSVAGTPMGSGLGHTPAWPVGIVHVPTVEARRAGAASQLAVQHDTPVVQQVLAPAVEAVQPQASSAKVQAQLVPSGALPTNPPLAVPAVEVPPTGAVESSHGSQAAPVIASTGAAPPQPPVGTIAAPPLAIPVAAAPVVAPAAPPRPPPSAPVDVSSSAVMTGPSLDLAVSPVLAGMPQAHPGSTGTSTAGSPVPATPAPAPADVSNLSIGSSATQASQASQSGHASRPGGTGQVQIGQRKLSGQPVLLPGGPSGGLPNQQMQPSSGPRPDTGKAQFSPPPAPALPAPRGRPQAASSDGAVLYASTGSRVPSVMGKAGRGHSHGLGSVKHVCHPATGSTSPGRASSGK